MKKLVLIASAFVLTFTSCDIKDTVEDAINENIPPAEQEISKDITIDAVKLEVAGPVSETITIDTSDINDQIDNASNENVKIESITLDDLEIKLADDSEQTNFDFLDSLKLAISSGGSDPILIDFGTIAKGVNSLKLPDDASTSILSLIQGSDVGTLTVDIDMVTNTAVENSIDLELVSTILAQLAIEL